MREDRCIGMERKCEIGEGFELRNEQGGEEV